MMRPLRRYVYCLYNSMAASVSTPIPLKDPKKDKGLQKCILMAF
jgi:hypothetical protein